MLVYLLNIAILLELVILYALYSFIQSVNSIPWCQFDGSYMDRMIDHIENNNSGNGI